jgi:hypothetical protein
MAGNGWILSISRGFSTFYWVFHISAAFPHLHPHSTVSAPLLRLAPASVQPYSRLMVTLQKFLPTIPRLGRRASLPAPET